MKVAFMRITPRRFGKTKRTIPADTDLIYYPQNTDHYRSLPDKFPIPRWLRNILRQVGGFFLRLQWKLTLAYTLATLATILILATVATALLYYLNFQSSDYPTSIAEALSWSASDLAPFLDQQTVNLTGLDGWLDEVTEGQYFMLKVAESEAQKAAGQFRPGYFIEVKRVSIVDRAGNILTHTAYNTPNPDVSRLTLNLTPAETEILQAALKGQTDPRALATRGPDYITAVAPVLGTDEEVVGALVLTSVDFPINAVEFIRNVLQGVVLPFSGIMLIVGVLVGLCFGFLLARGLTRRLQALSFAADAWSEGNFQILIKDTSGDELGRLARHLNYTAIQLQNLLQTRQELAGLEERNRLARDLHDSVKQQVFATAMQIGASKVLFDSNPEQACAHLVEAEQLVRQAQQELTNLILELRPAALEGKGLAQALRDYAIDWSRQTKIGADVRVRGERPLPLFVEQTLFRVAQEALANVARHSQASAAEICLVWQDGVVELTISDNGSGFNPGQINGRGVGLRSMTERLQVLNGQLEVKSQLGQGTQITAQIEQPEAFVPSGSRPVAPVKE
ncbi:MAG TPA: sensor histidine kinase [Anaerolineae bacterium]|nr:sensor histidine kinase [Anaerolineae bacterium]